MDLIVYKRITALGIAMGSISGLVAITPGAGYVYVQYSFVFGLISGVFCWLAVHLRKKYQLYDDLDVFSCHGICGLWGLLATRLFAFKKVNEFLPLNGLFMCSSDDDDDHYFIVYQIISSIVVPLYSGIMTYLILFLMTKCFNLRAISYEEIYL
jgi:Amt family ammonium transporter